VLPLAEELRSNDTDDLLRLEDVRVEVMRARGAGGQVRLGLLVLHSTPYKTKPSVCNRST
jgi:hypothetical protein